MSQAPCNEGIQGVWSKASALEELMIFDCRYLTAQENHWTRDWVTELVWMW
jgi:hypothetical protein